MSAADSTKEKTDGTSSAGSPRSGEVKPTEPPEEDGEKGTATGNAGASKKSCDTQDASVTELVAEFTAEESITGSANAIKEGTEIAAIVAGEGTKEMAVAQADVAFERDNGPVVAKKTTAITFAAELGPIAVTAKTGALVSSGDSAETGSVETAGHGGQDVTSSVKECCKICGEDVSKPPPEGSKGGGKMQARPVCRFPALGPDSRIPAYHTDICIHIDCGLKEPSVSKYRLLSVTVANNTFRNTFGYRPALSRTRLAKACLPGQDKAEEQAWATAGDKTNESGNEEYFFNSELAANLIGDISGPVPKEKRKSEGKASGSKRQRGRPRNEQVMHFFVEAVHTEAQRNKATAASSCAGESVLHRMADAKKSPLPRPADKGGGEYAASTTEFASSGGQDFTFPSLSPLDDGVLDGLPGASVRRDLLKARDLLKGAKELEAAMMRRTEVPGVTGREGHSVPPALLSKNYVATERLRGFILTMRDEAKTLMNSVRTEDMPAFEKFLRQLITFEEEHGHCIVPHNYADQNLSKFVSSVRTRYNKRENLSPQLRAAFDRDAATLNRIGFAWRDFNYKPWESYFADLLKFKEIFGHTRVPQKRTQEYKSLGDWVSNQRKRYEKIKRENLKMTPIMQERIDKLNSIGFEWRPGRGRPKVSESIP